MYIIHVYVNLILTIYDRPSHTSQRIDKFFGHSRNRHKNRRDNHGQYSVKWSVIIKILHRHRLVRWVHTDFQIFYPVELNWGRYYSVKTFVPIPQMYKMPKS